MDLLGRREFLSVSLAGLAWWRPQHRRALAGIPFDVIRNGKAPRRYLVIHGNEDTARAVLTAHMREARGTALLVASSARNVRYFGGELDPNRMFSHEGADRNLRSLNPSWGESQVASAVVLLNRRRYQLTNAVRPERGDVLIALHNNREYSLNDELANSNRTAVNDRDNPREFCLCTDPSDFERLKTGSFNVVLQNRPPGADDGSLSRYAVRNGFRYVNIEAAIGAREKQKAMLEWVDRILPGPDK